MSHERRFRYQEIAHALREQILRGDYDRRGRLPSERSLVERFKVQRNTVRQALSMLETSGQIRIEEKRGAFLMPDHVREQGKSFLLDIHGGFSPSLARLQAGFSERAAQAGYQVKLFDSHPSAMAALDPIPDPEQLDPDVAGVVVWPQNPTNRAALARLNQKVPTVLVDRRVSGLSIDCVCFNDFDGGKLVADHLFSLGHRRIAFIADDVFAETVQSRWRGYAAAHEARKAPFDPRLTQLFHGIDGPYFGMSIRYLLSLGMFAPTAFMCSNDTVAMCLIRHLHEAGVRVPTDVAVAGYGDAVPDHSLAVGLTTVHQGFHELGRSAAKILIERLGSLQAERMASVHDIEIPVRLVIRGSTKKQQRHRRQGRSRCG